MNLGLVVYLSVAAPALEELAPAEALAWIEVPNLAASLARLERSPMALLAALIAPRRERERVQAAQNVRLLAFWEVETTDVGWTAYLEANPGVPSLGEALRAWGDHRAVAPSPLAPAFFAAEGRIGAASSEMRAARALTPAPEPLEATAAYQRRRSPADDAVGALSVQRWYGRIVRSPAGRAWAGVLDRLGLLQAQALTGAVTVDERRGATVRAALDIAGEPAGVRAVFGPPLGRSRPGRVPAVSVGWAELSVRPQRLYELAQRLAAHLVPLEAALVRAHLATIEDRLGKRVGQHILGEAPRTWTMYAARESRGFSTVLLADLADTNAAVLLLHELAAAVPALFPEFEVRSKGVQGSTRFVVQRKGHEIAAVAVQPGTLVVAASSTALRAHLQRRSGKDIPAAESAVGRLVFTPELVRVFLRDSDAGRGLARAVAAQGVGESQLIAALGAVTARLAPKEGGLESMIELGNPRVD